MNYTITFSPSIDYVIDNHNQQFNAQGLTRIESCYFYPGGKGINASYIMQQMEIDNQCITFKFGRNYSFFYDLMKTHGLTKNLIELNLPTDLDLRINVKYFDQKNHFEINGPSPALTNDVYIQLQTKLKKLKQGDIVFIMGKCDESILMDLIKFIKDNGADFVIDIDAAILKDVLIYQPLVIKPNLDELSRLMNHTFDSTQAICEAMGYLKQQGAQQVIVSLGAQGSLLLDENNHFYQISFHPVNEIKSTVGCGDTLLTAYTCDYYNKQLSAPEAIINATALSMSTACHYFLGSIKEIDQFKPLIQIVQL